MGYVRYELIDIRDNVNRSGVKLVWPELTSIKNAGIQSCPQTRRGKREGMERSIRRLITSHVCPSVSGRGTDINNILQVQCVDNPRVVIGNRRISHIKE